MKVFDKEVEECYTCPYAKPLNDDYDLYNCNYLEGLISGDASGIAKNCPFKTENSFTDEQFEGIGFKKNIYGIYIKYYYNFRRAIERKDACVFAIQDILDNGTNEMKTTIEATSFPHLKFILDSLI